MEVISFKPQAEKNNEAADKLIEALRTEVNKYLGSVRPVSVVVIASQADGAVNMFEFNVNLGQAALASTMVSMLAHKKLMQSFQESPNQ